MTIEFSQLSSFTHCPFHNNTQAFGYSSACAGGARIAAAALGGYTYGIEPDTMRVVFKDMPGHGAPVVSHLIASGLCVAALLAFVFLYKDTSPAALRRESIKQQQQQQEAAETAAGGAAAAAFVPPQALEAGRSSEAPATEEEEDQPQPPTPAKAPGFVEGLRYVAGNRMLVLFIGCYAYTNLLSGMTLMAIPLLSSDQNKGLHMNTFETGMVVRGDFGGSVCGCRSSLIYYHECAPF